LSKFSAPGAPRRGDQPKHIFGQKEGADDPKSRVERVSPTLAPRRDSIDEHDRDAGREHHMVHGPKYPSAGRSRLGINEPVETLP